MCNLYFLSHRPPWWGGGVWQVPVAPCDPDQFSWFVDGESEPAEQLHLWKPHAPLQSACQPQPATLPGTWWRRIIRSSQYLSGVWFHQKSLAKWSHGTGSQLHLLTWHICEGISHKRSVVFIMWPIRNTQTVSGSTSYMKQSPLTAHHQHTRRSKLCCMTGISSSIFSSAAYLPAAISYQVQLKGASDLLSAPGLRLQCLCQCLSGRMMSVGSTPVR